MDREDRQRGAGRDGGPLVRRGAAALKQGKKIRYIGPGGPTSFDAYHDSTGIFQVDKYTADGTVKVVSNLSTSELRSLGL